MEKKKNFEIERKELRKFGGKPIWYQCLTDLNDFGWAFVHPDTVKPQAGGFPLGYCKLIKADPRAKDWYGWDEIRLFSVPMFPGICKQCRHYHKGTLTHCFRMENGEAVKCGLETKYAGFEPAPYYRERGYTARTFIRQVMISGRRITKEEKSC